MTKETYRQWWLWIATRLKYKESLKILLSNLILDYNCPEFDVATSYIDFYLFNLIKSPKNDTAEAMK